MIGTIDILIVFTGATLIVASTGITWAGILLSPGNLFDWLAPIIDRIPNAYLKDLLTCIKCVSGQVALWTFVALSVHFGLDWRLAVPACFFWVSWIIAVTDQLGKRLGYS